MKLAELLSKEAVFPHVDARDKKHALKHMASLAAALCPPEEKDIYAALLKREQQGSTCMGSGVCIPHAQFTTLERPHAFFARFSQPVAFEGADGKPVDLMFLLLSPQAENSDHVKAMALLSGLLRNEELRVSLRGADNAGALYDLLEVASNDNKAP